VPRSALIVAVPGAEPLVGEWRERYDNALLGIPAHVTILFPFVPAEAIGEELLVELRALFGSQPAFSFTLPRVARFPEIAWLAPEPDEPFRRLTELIFSRYPDYPPYEGVHDEVIPHLTVGEGDAAFQDEVDAALTPHLPIAAEVREVVLLEERADGHWKTRESFPLGG
jgi:2'-5' RNA ligase superfamily protein